MVNMKHLLTSNLVRRIVFIFFDISAFTLSLFLAFEIRFEHFLLASLPVSIFTYLCIFLFIKLTIFYFFRLYDISWRFVSLQDLANIGRACLISSLILFVVAYGLNLQIFKGFPRSVLWIDLFLGFLFSSGFKIAKRMYFEVMRQSVGKSELKRTLIVGAGRSGEQLLRDINRSPKRTFNLVGFIDDDPLKHNLYLQGIKVLGTTENLKDIIKNYRVETVLISVLSAGRNFHRKILNIAKEAGINDVKVISTINDISESLKIGVKDIRDIDVTDLIGRQAVSINTKIIKHYLYRKRVLITGAAGSIGSEIARQVTIYEPEEIGILDINESDLSDLELQLNRLVTGTKIQIYLCDISNNQKVHKVFSEFKPEIVFHAAAFKHVPIMEKFPEESVRVNILGTNNVANAAKLFKVESFVLISTDKAVNPTSIMGASKRVAEHIVTGLGKDSVSNFVAVRFGNVIGSRGSALPIFINQLKNGGPITITHPDMKRYFMTIPEAVALVLQAGATGKNGDVFVLDMGEPIKIVDLVRDLILLNNLIPGTDIEIQYTGIREGEKLFEEVLTAEEGVIATSHEKIFRARLVCMHNSNSINSMLDEFRAINGHATKQEWIELLKFYVPTFQPSSDFDRFDTEFAGVEPAIMSIAQGEKR